MASLNVAGRTLKKRGKLAILSRRKLWGEPWPQSHPCSIKLSSLDHRRKRKFMLYLEREKQMKHCIRAHFISKTLYIWVQCCLNLKQVLSRRERWVWFLSQCFPTLDVYQGQGGRGWLSKISMPGPTSSSEVGFRHVHDLESSPGNSDHPAMETIILDVAAKGKYTFSFLSI